RNPHCIYNLTQSSLPQNEDFVVNIQYDTLLRAGFLHYLPVLPQQSPVKMWIFQFHSHQLNQYDPGSQYSHSYDGTNLFRRKISIYFQMITFASFPLLHTKFIIKHSFSIFYSWWLPLKMNSNNRKKSKQAVSLPSILFILILFNDVLCYFSFDFSHCTVVPNKSVVYV